MAAGDFEVVVFQQAGQLADGQIAVAGQLHGGVADGGDFLQCPGEIFGGVFPQRVKLQSNRYFRHDGNPLVLRGERLRFHSPRRAAIPASFIPARAGWNLARLPFVSVGMDGKDPEDEKEEEIGKNRIEALSDGIFAIAMTLLILNFHVPVLPPNAPNVVVVPALLRMWPAFVSYVVSFISLGMFWVGHHNMYYAVRRADRVLLWLNIVFFLFVSFLPFSTSILNAFRQTQIAPLFFGANLTLIGWLLYAQWTYARRQNEMLAGFLSPEYQAQVSRRFLAYPLVAMLTMAICFWSVPISLAVYLVLLPLYMISGKGGRTRAEAPKEARRRWLKPLIGTAAGLSLAVGAWAAFRPELLFVPKTVHDAPLTAASGLPVALESGRFHGVAHATRGLATVYQTAGAGRTLRLSGFETSNGPDVRVYLIAAPDASNNAAVTAQGYKEVGRLRGSRGDQNYPLPPNLDLSRFHAVTIWCRRFAVNFATAPLLPASPAPPSPAGTASRRETGSGTRRGSDAAKARTERRALWRG